MRRSWLLVALALLLLPLAARPESKAGAGKPEAEIRAFLEEMNAAWSRKDGAWFAAHYPRDADMVHFGTDAAEYWVGWDAIRKAMDAQLAALGTIKGTLRDVRVKVYRTGDLAWVSYFFDFEGTSGGQPFAVKGMRVTAVLEKQKGTWVFASSHSSMGVEGQVVKY